MKIKKNKKSKGDVKQELIKSLVWSKKYESEELNSRGNNAKRFQHEIVTI